MKLTATELDYFREVLQTHKHMSVLSFVEVADQFTAFGSRFKALI
jgi:hypothetical protein